MKDQWVLLMLKAINWTGVMPKTRIGRSHRRLLRKQVFNRDNGICKYCKYDCKIIDNQIQALVEAKDFNGADKLIREYGLCGPTYWTIHHIKPINEGGNHKLDNLITLCQDCHAKLHNRKIK